MKRRSLAMFFFIIYTVIVISNLSPVMGITNPGISAILNYGGFFSLILAFVCSSPLIKHGAEFNVHYKMSFALPLFVLVFYLVSVFISLILMNYESLFIVLPSLIRCSISVVIFNWLFSYFLYVGKMDYHLKIFAIIVTASAASIMCFNLMGLELSYLVDTDLQSPDGSIIGRSSGVYLNANAAAQFSLYAVIMLLFFIQRPNQHIRYKLLIFSALFICIYGIILTFSITGFLSLALILTYFVYNRYRSKIKFLIHFLLFFLGFQVLIFSLKAKKDDLYAKYDLPRVQQEKIDNILNIASFSNSQKIDYSYRDKLADTGLERIESRPFFGFGAGEFMTNVIGGIGIHNTYLQIIGEAGFFVFIFYLVICFTLLKRCYLIRDKPFNFLLTSMSIVSLMYQLTTHGILYNEALLLVLVMINCISLYVKRREKEHLANAIESYGSINFKEV